MSPAPHDSAQASKTELETVTRWPALLAAAGAGVLLLGVPLLLAVAAALRSLPREAAARPAPPPQAAARPVVVQPLEFPQAAPLALPEPRQEPVPEARIVTLPPRVRPAPPPPPEPAVEPPARISPIRTHYFLRDHRTEAEYLEELRQIAREVDLEAEKGTAARILAAPKEKAKQASTAGKELAHPLLALLPQRPDLAGLPARGAKDCERDRKAAARICRISIQVRELRDERDRRESPFPNSTLASMSHQATLDLAFLKPDKLEEVDIATLVQMLQAEDMGTRLNLVQVLSTYEARAATEALARRALFDLAPEVRLAAVRALKPRPASDYRPILLQGLRHPWPPVARHAADTLVALSDREAVPTLVDLLDEPDPCAPVRGKDGRWVQAELVRVNHLRNCLLCHAPALDRRDVVRAPVPTPGKPLPRLYYNDRSGTSVRFDVTYFRQDFSVMQPVAKAEPWPALQRFDYLVRQRELTAAEVAAHAAATAAAGEGKPASYPQRRAVLFALGELTGLQAGDSSLDWRLALWMSGEETGP